MVVNELFRPKVAISALNLSIWKLVNLTKKEQKVPVLMRNSKYYDNVQK